MSGGGGEGPGEPGESGRAGLGRRGPAALRERVGRQGRGGEGNAGRAAPGLGPSRGTRHLPWGPATCSSAARRALPRFPGPALRRKGNKLLCRPFCRAAVRGLWRLGALPALRGLSWAPRVPVAASLGACLQWAQCRQSLLRDNGGGVTCCSPRTDRFGYEEYSFLFVYSKFYSKL